MWVDLIQSVEGLNKIKSLTLPLVRENSPCLMVFHLVHRFFPSSGLKLKRQLFLDLEPVGLQTGTKPSTLLGLQLRLTLNISGLASLHDHVN